MNQSDRMTGLDARMDDLLIRLTDWLVKQGDSGPMVRVNWFVNQKEECFRRVIKG